VYQLSGPILSEDFNEAGCLTRGEKLMVASNPNDRSPSAGSGLVPPVNRLAERVRHYFDRHPEASQEEFLLDAVGREIVVREREDDGNGHLHTRPEGQRTGPRSGYRPPLTEEDIRIHAWLNERLAALHRERNGLWSKIRRLLFGNHLAR
jgi:hypothetical protein